MRKFLPLIILFSLLIVAGCGGSAGLGTNANIVIHLQRTDSTQNLTQYEVYITQLGDTTLDTSDKEDFASTINQPSWSDNWSGHRSSSELKLGFRTRSTQTPYFVWVKVPNTGAAFETLKLKIDINGNDGKTVTNNLQINTTQRLTGVKINRDSADY